MTAAPRWFLGVVVVGGLLSLLGCATTPLLPPVTEAKPTFSTEAPPGAPYHINSGDELRVTVYREGDLSTLIDVNPAMVMPDGTLLLPMVGELTAAGLTPAQLRDQIASRLEDALAGDATYRIRTQDELAITVQRRSDLSNIIDLKSVLVLPDGRILLPLAGELTAAGLTPAQLAEEIATRLQGLFVQPVVSVIVRPSRPQISPVVSVIVRPTKPKIYVLGEVKTPGLYRIDRDTTALEALALAGGMTREADTAQVVLIRTTKVNGPEAALAAASFEDLFKKADVRQNVVLQAGDIIYVPPDHIARANRIMQYVGNIVSPFAQVLGVISSIVILSRVGN